MKGLLATTCFVLALTGCGLLNESGDKDTSGDVLPENEEPTPDPNPNPDPEPDPGPDMSGKVGAEFLMTRVLEGADVYADIFGIFYEPLPKGLVESLFNAAIDSCQVLNPAMPTIPVTKDAGATVTVTGAISAATLLPDSGSGFTSYYVDDPFALTLDPGQYTVAWAGSAAIPVGTSTGHRQPVDFVPSTAVVEPVQVTAGQPYSVSWVPGGTAGDRVVFIIEGGADSYICLATDDGAFEVPASTTSLFTSGQTLDVAVGRLAQTDGKLPDGSTIRVFAMSGIQVQAEVL